MIIKVKNNKSAFQESPFLLFLVKADQHLYNLLLLNTLLDPIVYAVRIRKVRAGYIRLFCHWKCCRRLPYMNDLLQRSLENTTYGRQSFTLQTDFNSSDKGHWKNSFQSRQTRVRCLKTTNNTRTQDTTESLL